MCGIYFSLGSSDSHRPDQETASSLRARGPDACDFVTSTVEGQDSVEPDHRLRFYASVLGLRGEEVYKQPIVDPRSGSVFCWNGEAWKYDNRQVLGNDSGFVFKALQSAAASASPQVSIVSTLDNITGPFAFVYYDALSSTIYYGRDRLGRRSLILQRQSPHQLTLCSVSTSAPEVPEEVSTEYIHSLAMVDGAILERHISWPSTAPGINTTTPNESTIGPSPCAETVDSLLLSIVDSLRLRVLDIPGYHLSGTSQDAAKVAILFSGGLDCTLLARLVHDILPLTNSIDLLNVAFENPRTMKARTSADSAYEICPDRMTGRTSLAELERVCPNRLWRFVAIDVPYSEAMAHKADILRLIRPHNTEMDLSIAMALYFAARGQGNVSADPCASQTLQPYSTPARVLLSGLGADEVFGGYIRHGKAFERSGFQGLIEELDLDFKRIGSRNLGRDDRVISHWAKEVRYPYLDENFVRFALALPVWEKCGFRRSKPVLKHYESVSKVAEAIDLDPSKMLLRLALWRLGMRSAAAEKKRAIQFGAKTAKMEMTSGRRKGTEALTSADCS